MTRSGASVRQLQALDRHATSDYHIPVVLLMEHAAMAVAQACERHVSSTAHRVVCLAGSGHNGGDGLAAMRLLHARGYSPEVFLLGSSTNLQGEPALFLRMLQSVGVPTRFLQHEADWAAYQHSVAAADVLVDALLGTGFTGTLRPEAARAITDMNQGTGTRIAVDIPSGLYADTGHIETVAIRAHMTVTFAAAKQGFFTQQGREHLGELVVDPIALPPQLLTETLIP